MLYHCQYDGRDTDVANELMVDLLSRELRGLRGMHEQAHRRKKLLRTDWAAASGGELHQTKTTGDKS